MLTGCVGQVDVTERTEVTETTGEVGGKVLEFERATTLLALRDWMIPARPEQQGAFGRSQHQVARRLRSSPPESSTLLLTPAASSPSGSRVARPSSLRLH